MINFEELDKYKEAIDNEFNYQNDLDLYSPKLKEAVLCSIELYKYKNVYRFLVSDYMCNIIINIKETDYEVFKQKIIKFFSENI